MSNDPILISMREIDAAKSSPLHDAIANAGKDGQVLDVHLTKQDGLEATGSINTGHDTALSGGVSTKEPTKRSGWNWWLGFSWRPK
jgi:hypothetical protein